MNCPNKYLYFVISAGPGSDNNIALLPAVVRGESGKRIPETKFLVFSESF